MIIIDDYNNRIVIKRRHIILELEHYFDKFKLDNVYYYRNSINYTSTYRHEFVLGINNECSENKIKLIKLLKTSKYLEYSTITDVGYAFKLSIEGQLNFI